MHDLSKPWHDQPVVPVLVGVILDLSRAGDALRVFDHQLFSSDPSAVIGTLDRGVSYGLVHRASPQWETNGGSAIEACFTALADIRSEWIDERAEQQRVGKGWPERYSVDDDPAEEFHSDLNCTLPTVSDAIDMWRAPRSVRRAA